MAAHADNVPRWVRIAVGILAVLNIAYGVVGYLNMSVLFHAGTGIDFTNPLIKNANDEFASRNLAIGLALGFVTMIKGAPEALVILTIVRALTEIQTIILAIVQGNINAMLILPVVFLAVEMVMVKTLIGVIKLEEAEG
jgi:uncharacterized membrane protein YhdT